MSNNRVNLFFRFLLEVCAIVTFGVWGYGLSDQWPRILLAGVFPLLFAGIWGVFAVPNDPSRSGKTVIPTPGTVRLALELLLFSAATWMLIGLGKHGLGWIFGGMVMLHYVISYDRIAWLLRQR
jgi:hypothetical protein